MNNRLMKWLWNPEEHYFLSSYGLALFRIGLGISIVLEQVARIRHFDVIYSSKGIVPLTQMSAIYTQLHLKTVLPSLHLAMQTDLGLKILMWSQLAFGLLLILGIGSRWLLIPIIYLICSYNISIFLFSQYTSQLMFWICILALIVPLDRQWAVRRDTGAPADQTLTISAIILVAAISFLLGHAKSGISWFDGTALKIALQRSDLTTGMGRRWAETMQISPDLTQFLKNLETWGPTLFLLPSPLLRTVACFALMGMSIFMGSLFHLGVLMPMMIALWTAFLPREFFAALGLTESEDRNLMRLPRNTWETARSGLTILVALLILIWANALRRPIVQRKPGAITRSTFTRPTAVFKYGTTPLMSNLAPNPRAKINWIQVNAIDEKGNRTRYDFIADRWAGAPNEMPPVSVFDEYLHNERLLPIIPALARSLKDQNYFWPKWKSYLCRKIQNQPEQNGNRIEAISYFSFITHEGKPLKPKRVPLFELDCGKPET